MRAFIALSVLALAACTNAAQTSLVPVSPGAEVANATTRQHPAAYSSGIYIGQFSGNAVFGYANQNRRNAPPVCGENGIGYVADVGTDPAGNLMVPSQMGETISVFNGPKMCGPQIAKIGDPYGLPVDVASRNASSGTIAVANIEDDGPISNPPPGSITTCTISAGCTANLTNKEMFRVAGVAISDAGDCWASAYNAKNKATLIYFAGCAGGGLVATGYKNETYGGLEIDKNGHLLAIDYGEHNLYIYSGCNPACSPVAGPLSLRGDVIYGKLNAKGTLFATTDYTGAKVDVYTYTGTSIKHSYSFDQGLIPSSAPEGIAFSPGA